MIGRVFAAVIAVVSLAVMAPSASALPAGIEEQVFIEHLQVPVDLAWERGTRRIFFTERRGPIRVAWGRQVLPKPCASPPVDASGERGMVGIVLHPGFSENHWLYVYYTRKLMVPESPAKRIARVVRFTVSGNRCTDPLVITDDIRADGESGYHNGGRLSFVGDKLFVSTGDSQRPPSPQRVVDPDTGLPDLNGKILRFNDDGSVPKHNPFSSPGAPNPVWAYGLRNPFGLTSKPGAGWLFASDNGPKCDDELNRLQAGGNFGWGPDYECGRGLGPDPLPPLRRWTPTIVPTDIEWYSGSLRRLKGSLFMGRYGPSDRTTTPYKLLRFDFDADGNSVTRSRIVHRISEPILGLDTGPRGLLYLLTPSRILRFAPR